MSTAKRLIVPGRDLVGRSRRGVMPEDDEWIDINRCESCRCHFSDEHGCRCGREIPSCPPWPDDEKETRWKAPSRRKPRSTYDALWEEREATKTKVGPRKQRNWIEEQLRRRRVKMEGLKPKQRRIRENSPLYLRWRNRGRPGSRDAVPSPPWPEWDTIPYWHRAIEDPECKTPLMTIQPPKPCLPPRLVILHGTVGQYFRENPPSPALIPDTDGKKCPLCKGLDPAGHDRFCLACLKFGRLPTSNVRSASAAGTGRPARYC